ncbi:MAG: MoaD family protein [Thermoplasmata archaeon]
MRVHLKLFASFREVIGEKDLVMDVKDGWTVGDVVTELLSRYPKLERLKETMIYSVNKEYASLTKKLSDGDEVGILPPISGG